MHKTLITLFFKRQPDFRQLLRPLLRHLLRHLLSRGYVCLLAGFLAVASVGCSQEVPQEGAQEEAKEGASDSLREDAREAAQEAAQEESPDLSDNGIEPETLQVREGLPEMTTEELQRYEFNVEEDPAMVKDLSVGQQYILNRQRRDITDLIARHLGVLNLKGDKRDLDLLQKLLDQKVVTTDDLDRLQSIGVVFGDILVRELGLQWVSYEDEYGLSRALRWRKTENYVFPVSMFSKRAQFKEDIQFTEVFAKIEQDTEAFKEFEASKARYK